MNKLIKMVANVILASFVIVAIGLAAPAHADVDPTDYYDELRSDGFLVNGNEQYLYGLAMTVCDLKNAGESTSDIGDYIARRETLPDIKGYDIALDADIYFCTQLHPRLLP